MRGMGVALFAASGGNEQPVVLGRARSAAAGSFSLSYKASGSAAVKYLVTTRPGGAAEAGFPVSASAYRLAAALGAGAVPKRATVNERTTVAIGYAMAQFTDGAKFAGKNPGLRNAAAMTQDLVNRRGGLSPVLERFPNGGATSTLATFDSLANLLGSCRAQGPRCARLLALTGVPGGGPAADTLAATTNLARYPWHNAGALYKLSLRARGRFAPALAPGEKPDGWTLALRFEGGSPRGLDGPGNFAIDAGGNLWVGNNYEYSRRSRQPSCFGREILRFTPTGRYFAGSPYASGGLSGVGFGITIDPFDHVWAGNFGFAGKGCTEEPPSNSVSEFNLRGEALSPDLTQTGEREVSEGVFKKTFKGGWEDGEISWPQATVSDKKGNIWIANCGNNSVTKYVEGNHEAAINYPQSDFQIDAALPKNRFGFSRPFGIAIDPAGDAYVTANDSATVVKLNREGKVLRRIKGGGLHRPLGIASDSRGNVWVGNSTWVVAPCVGEFHQQRGPGKGGSVTLIKRGGKVAAGPISNGGIRNAWGIAIDGKDNVWVANFSGQRLSELCGARPQNCPRGKRRTGAAISPEGTGYGFDGLVRNTGVAVDPSGNVWLANNWKQKAIQTNPGGYQIVAYLGIAAPVKAPLIGPPEQP